MKKNQKYNKEEMALAIEMWQESGLSQYEYCNREKLSKSTFSYWLKKYKQERGQYHPEQRIKSFIPVKVTTAELKTLADNSIYIEISYPNGVMLSCPANTDVSLIKSLIII